MQQEIAETNLNAEHAEVAEHFSRKTFGATSASSAFEIRLCVLSCLGARRCSKRSQRQTSTPSTPSSQSIFPGRLSARPRQARRLKSVSAFSSHAEGFPEVFPRTRLRAISALKPGVGSLR